MILVKPSYEILTYTPLALQTIEFAGRTCYKSEDRITEDSAEKFVEMVIRRGHYSVTEHAVVTVKIICDRGVTHEVVRHRLASYSQESTRYCNYKSGVTFIMPPWIDDVPIGEYPLHMGDPGIGSFTSKRWFQAMHNAEVAYITLLNEGWSPQQARSVLPNSLKTEIVITANVREWRHIFTLRCHKTSHPQMNEIMRPLHQEMRKLIPIIFDDIEY